jgi:Cu/Ag efflux pump CusA
VFVTAVENFVLFGALVTANLPLALIGGVVMVFLSGGTLSVASLAGFITLFGIATRNGIMLISHYSHLMVEEGVGFRDALVQGSMERLSPIMMTALVIVGGFVGAAVLLVVLASRSKRKSRGRPPKGSTARRGLGKRRRAGTGLEALY